MRNSSLLLFSNMPFICDQVYNLLCQCSPLLFEFLITLYKLQKITAMTTNAAPANGT